MIFVAASPWIVCLARAAAFRPELTPCKMEPPASVHPSGAVSSATPHCVDEPPAAQNSANSARQGLNFIYSRNLQLGGGFSIVVHPSNSSGPGHLRGFRHQLTVLTVTSLCFSTFLNREARHPSWLLVSSRPSPSWRTSFPLHGESRRESGVAVESARECGLDVPPPGTKAGNGTQAQAQARTCR